MQAAVQYEVLLDAQKLMCVFSVTCSGKASLHTLCLKALSAVINIQLAWTKQCTACSDVTTTKVGDVVCTTV